jgi:peptidoglycan LD-endopeptidase CwlK
VASLGTLEDWLYPTADTFVGYLQASGLGVYVTSARRSFAQQAALYDRWLAGASDYPAAPPGTSYHEFGRAFDLGGYPKDWPGWPVLGRIWESLGGRWGGRFADPIHFEA